MKSYAIAGGPPCTGIEHPAGCLICAIFRVDAKRRLESWRSGVDREWLQTAHQQDLARLRAIDRERRNELLIRWHRSSRALEKTWMSRVWKGAAAGAISAAAILGVGWVVTR